jgi:heme A synthase
LTGGSCGLFVAAHIARSDFNLISSGAAILAMMIYGASGFYLGIDLPPAPQKLRELSLRSLGSRADAVELLSATGTFLTAVVAVIAVSNIILDELASPRGAMSVFLGWALGASMQIAAGIIARTRTHIS